MDGFYRLEHSSFGKSHKSYAPGKLVEHAVYISRLSAEQDSVAVNFSRNPHKFRREVDEYEKSVTRKNARLLDKVVLNFDKRMSHDHRKEAVQDFLWSVTRGKGRARAAFHDIDGGNPHAHLFIIDKCDGKSVQGLSDSPRDRAKKGLEPNGTGWLRKLWQDKCNNVLAEHEYEFRVDHRTRLGRGLEAAGEHKEWRKRAVIEMASAEVEFPHTKSEIVVEPDMTPDELADHLAQIADDSLDDLATVQFRPEDLIRGALDLDREIHHVKATQEKISALIEESAAALEAAQRYKSAAHQHDMKSYLHRDAALMAGDDLAPLLRQDGSYRGFSIKILGKEIESPKHKRAKLLDGEIRYQEYLSNESKRWANEDLHHAERMATKAKECVERAEASKRELDETRELYGDDQTLEECLVEMDANIRMNLQGITPEDIVALHENGELVYGKAVRTLELMAAHEYIVRIELRDRQEREQEASERDDGPEY